ncbi:MAG: RimK/LysX family protein [Balneolaceae bacterium]|nr:RimK/LysX family protein [Balneolaceae bacterium]
MQKEKSKSLIGRLEKIDLPELSLKDLDAKIDTGAYTSSLHCHKIDLFEKEGKQWVSFHVLDPEHPVYEERLYEAPVHRLKQVRSSNGQIEERVIIGQSVIFNGQKGRIQLSLTNRSEMKYPVLIGRRFLADKYIVDVSKKFLAKPNN